MSNRLGAEMSVGFKPEAVPGTPEATVNLFLPHNGFLLFDDPKPIEREVSFMALGKKPGIAGHLKPRGKVMTELYAGAGSKPLYWMMALLQQRSRTRLILQPFTCTL